MYYRYEIVNELYKLCEKSSEELTGENVVTCDEDIDLKLFDVTVGYISENSEMLRHTKKINNAEVLAGKLYELRTENTELKERLTLIELVLNEVLLA